ncbi:aldo/keto reductase [Streptomyces sp. MnatMP-M17]|uniref:aldo/keto reductase n=1 Tax=unclassified Streptomyces TaxID=2593676 RepID=UPI00081EDEDE|nr:aldo/keto reductase [Streptomyces sp. MnatMP-M17]MYZ40909.1 aldo/keto reductase [Streptomyces sp. SID4917]SCG08932.1 D-threo-aldose 1-dehydrogenase [Streptomyces sp. MnatMP-M17]
MTGRRLGRNRRLGRTDVRVSALGFGGAPLGNLYAPLGDDQARATVEAAWDAGVRYFDTAPHYGLGLSERRLGAALAHRPRAEFTVSTKVGRLLEPHPAPTGSDLAAGGFAVPDTLIRRPDYSRDGVLRSLEGSLTRLGLDRVDVVYVHDPDDHLDTALDQALPALAALRDQGVIGAVGVGMNTVAPLLRIVAEADVDAVMVAGRWTLIDRTARPLLDACAERGVAVVAAAPFNSGLLSRPYPPDEASFDYGPAPAALLRRARHLADICTAHHTTLPHAALRFPLRAPAVPTVVAGFRTPQEATSAAHWTAHDLPANTWSALDSAA